MSTSSTSNAANSAALTSLLGSLGTTSAAAANSTSTAGPLITTGQINVSQIVSELMTIQEQPLLQIQNREAGVKATLSAYGQEQSALSSLQSAAQALALPSSFEQAAAAVSGSGVAATVTGTPASGTYTVDVSGLAQAQSVASASVSSASATVGTGTLTIQLGTAANGSFTAAAGANPITVTIDSTNDTLNGIASAINSAAAGSVNASVVTNADGSSQLVVSSTNTGTANEFSITPSSGLSQFAFNPAATGTQAMTQTQPAADASFSVNGLALTASTNTVTTAISGVALNLTEGPAAGGAPLQSQVTIATDPGAVTDSVNKFISAYNGVISLTNSLSAYNSSTNTGSVLTGDSPTRNMVEQLQSIMNGQTTASGTTSAYSWLAEVGVTPNSDGTLALNSTQFQSALAANPTAVAAMFTSATGTGAQQGFPSQIAAAAAQLIGANGAIGAAQAAQQSQITYMDSQQAVLQAELNQKQAALTQEYSALNAAVSAATQEQTQLANELASLPG